MQTEHDDTALAGIDALVTQVEEGVRIIQKLTDRLLAAEKRLDEMEHYVGRLIRQDKNPY